MDIDFFEGKRPLNGTVFSLKGGKVTLTCTPWEEWELIAPCPFTLRCGNRREQTLTQRFGIERTQSSSFETTIGSTLGNKGVAAIERSLKSTIGEEIKFQSGTEVTQTFSFDSPACGYKVVKLYQKVRKLHMRYDDQRFWHRDAKELTMIQWLKSIYDATIAEQYDPQCNCSKPIETSMKDGIAARVSCGNIAKQVIAKLAVFIRDNLQLEFPESPESLNSYFPGIEWKGKLPSDALPDYLRFLAGIDTGVIMEANVWQESVFFANRPDFGHKASMFAVELDENFKPISGNLDFPNAGTLPVSQYEESK